MLLVDQNLPRALARHLKQAFPGTVHVTDLHMERETDTAIWSYALEHKLAIVSKDSDFYDRLTIKGFPPKTDLGQNRKRVHYFSDRTVSNSSARD